MTTKEHIAQIIASILAIVPEAREAMEAALHPVATGKPRAGEWTTQGWSSVRLANGGTVQTVWHTGGWIVYGSTSKSGKHWSGNVDLPWSTTPADRLAAAQAASDACAREHAGELDWEPVDEHVGVAGMERLHRMANIRERVNDGTISDGAAAMTAPQPPDAVPALPEGWTEDVISLWAVDEKGTMRASWWPSGRWRVWHSNGEIPFASSNTGGRAAALRALKDAGELEGKAAAPSLHRMGLDVLYLATSENGARFQLSGKEIAQILEMVALAAGDGEDMMTATRRIAARSDAHKALKARCERAERNAGELVGSEAGGDDGEAADTTAHKAGETT